MDFKNMITTVVVMAFMMSILAGVMILNVMKYSGGI
jgi:hypothetical protein|tara:strand:+ start:29277 stop:29384 length:108 start_codon:yes stop_codon:yes gene_type:complete